MKRKLMTFIAVLCWYGGVSALAAPNIQGETIQNSGTTPGAVKIPVPPGYREILVAGLEVDVAFERRFLPEFREHVEQISGLHPTKFHAVRYLVKDNYPMDINESRLAKVRLFHKGTLVDTVPITLFGHHEEARSGPRKVVVFSGASEADTFEVLFDGRVVHRSKLDSFGSICRGADGLVSSGCDDEIRILKIDSRADGLCSPHDGDPLLGVRLDPDCAEAPPLLCANGRLSIGEQGIDCGGVCEQSCP